ncbi:RHS repeat-associated core domain-containing protein [Brevibacillus ruminantium]|uniref:RHS repeat-associated core domain-containing protein n=1 Tax=Brevibacillus ruminantium TaxID=2950604 RepID=A0ABY4WFQ4_9BACL|nr:RHS repeat-associated core domain-containing protein [Brevibacillus ruminantium]USG64645.1 RHS repeat-associated core domain-containing protein [Brevibacillus ruminantium]
MKELDKNNQLQARNIWGNELLFRKDTAANKQGYYLYNSHGDVVKIVGEQGEELNRYEYDTWGNIVSKKEEMSNPFAYSGEMFDNETGFYYLRARYYDPTVGRFISEDTYKGQVDNPLSLNRYTYVHNNPLRFVDPSGRKAAEGAGGYFGGSYEDLMLYWAEKAAAYANANNIADYGDAVDIVVPTEHRAEVKTIVYQNGSVKAWEMAGDLPGLGLGAAGAGAAAASLKNTGKNSANGAANTKRSQHSLERKSQGRPTGTAFNDAQKARDADILIQDDGRWIVRGQNGRIHVFEPDGQHLTTFKNPDNNTKIRIQRGQWTRPSQESIQKFRDILNSLLK